MIYMQQLNNDKYKDSKLKQQIGVTRFNEYSQTNNTLDALPTSVCHTKHTISPISGVVNTFMVHSQTGSSQSV